MSADAKPVPRVLIAESDPWVREMLTQTLLSVRCDAELDICASGSEALERLQTDPDLIIAARELPGVDGLALLRQVRRAHREIVPFILLSERSDGASVREALPLAPTAYLTKPLNMDSFRQRVHDLLLESGEEVFCEVPQLMVGVSLEAFLDERREHSDGGPLMADVQRAVKRSLNPQGLNLRALEEEIRADPQVTAVLIAAANSAAQHRETPVENLLQALSRLGATQSMNLILGLTLKRSARIQDPLLAGPAEVYWNLSLHTAEFARTLARVLKLDQDRAYCAGILHCLGELALLRTLQEWRLGGGSLTDSDVTSAINSQGASFGSALRTRWRLPLALRDLIAAVHRLGGGVYTRDLLVMNLAGMLARYDRSTGEAGLERIAESKTARLLKMDSTTLKRLIKN